MSGEREKVRVSCAHLGIIEVGNKYALLRAIGSAVDKYSAPGGHMRCTPEARKYLEEECEATFPEDSNDLILNIPEKKVPEFEEWFNKREGRDTIRPELEQELTQENPILDNLEGVEITYKETHKARARSTRKGHEGVLTRYFVDVYVVELTSDQQKRMKDFAAKNDNLALLTADELRQQEYKGVELQADIISMYI